MGNARLLGTTRGMWLGLAVAALLLAALAVAPASAAAATLFGAVSSQQPGSPVAPVAGASVTVLDPQTTTVVAFTTTAVDGTYSVEVPSGTYDVRFDPGPSGGVAPVTATAIQVDVTRELDVVLVPSGIVRVSGLIRGPNGPIPNLRLRLYPMSPSDPGQSTATADDGSYSFAVASGTYRVGADRLNGPEGLPGAWWFASDEFDLSADRTLDVTLPTSSVLTVRALGSDESPLVGAGVDLTDGRQSATFDGVPVTFGIEELSGTTDQTGEARFAVFTGTPSCAGTVTPGPGSGYGSQAFATPEVDADTTVVVHPPPSVRVSGVIRGPDGSPIAGLRVRLKTDTEVVASATTGEDGSYAVTAAPGSYSLQIEQRSSVVGWPSSWALLSETFDLAADRTVDVTLPASSTLTVRVLGSDGAPLLGADVELPGYARSAEFDGLAFPYVDSGSTPATTDQNGEAHFTIFDGSSTQGVGTVTPSPGSGYGTGTFSLPAIDGDVTVVAQPPASVHLSGVIRGPAGPVAGLLLRLVPTSFSGSVEETSTAEDGSYAFSVSSGTYSLDVEQRSALAGLPNSWWFASETFDLTENRTLDVTLPSSSVLTVRVLGSDGSPLGAVVDLSTYSQSVLVAGIAFHIGTSELAATTDQNGEARFTVFDGSNTGVGVITPGGGYAPRPLTLPDVEGDTTVLVQFAPLDTAPPTISCDPAPAGWHAEEVSVACTASDSGSGLANPSDASFSLTTSVGDGNEDAAAQTGTRQVCDRAGNCATAGPIGPISVDRSPPSIAFSQQPDGGGGWWRSSPATVHVVASDLTLASLACAVDGVPQALVPTAGPSSLAADVTVAGEGRHTVSCTAGDAVGHSTVTNEPVLIDLTAPNAPGFAADRAPDYGGRGGWYRDAVTVSVLGNGDPALADGSPGSGVDPASIPTPQTFATSGNHAVSASVADVAGNRSTVATAVFKVDADPPTTTLACPVGTVRVGARASARWKDRDGESGLATPANGSIALDTSTAGAFTVRHDATDNVGHSATSSCIYRVG